VFTCPPIFSGHDTPKSFKATQDGFAERLPAIEREERWRICEDLAHQLVPKAVKDAMAHPEHDRDVTLERVSAAVARKGWVSEDELAWLISRLRALLNW